MISGQLNKNKQVTLPVVWSHDTDQRIHCKLIINWMSNIKDVTMIMELLCYFQGPQCHKIKHFNYFLLHHLFNKLIVSSQRKPMNASEDSMEFHEFDRKSCKIYHSCLVHVHVDDKNF